MRKRIVVSEAMPGPGMELLKSRTDLETLVLSSPCETQLAAMIPSAHAVIIVAEAPFLGATTIVASPLLVVAARMGAGTDNFDIRALTARRIPLLTTGAANAGTVAEHALYLMLALAKRGPARDRAVKLGHWPRGFGAVELAGATCLVVGMGRIGREIVRRAKAFDMRVLGYDPQLTTSQAAATGLSLVQTLPEGLGQADIVVIACALTAETRGLFGTEALAAMRPTALLVNVSRGAVVDEVALAAALSAGRLAGAGLDVMATEPPVSSNPLLARDDVVLSPHTASHVATTYERMSLVCARQVIDALDGRIDPTSVVNPEVLV